MGFYINTDKVTADRNIKEAARRAALVFEEENWTYSDGAGNYVPNIGAIKETIRDLIDIINIGDRGAASTGRIFIQPDDLVGYSIQLEIGSLTEEELCSVRR